MRRAVYLMGAMRVELDGVEQPPPRGHKPWAILAYLLLSRTRVTRSALSELLFAEAKDPQAALRWNLSELRRLLVAPEVLRGDPLFSPLGPGDTVDAWALAGGEVSVLESVGGDLLASLSLSACPSYEVWLEIQRRHLRGSLEALLHEQALVLLAQGAGSEAADVAGRLVVLDPLDENAQVLLVRCLAAAGEGVAAARQAAACRDLFRRELGVAPGPALDAAMATVTASPVAAPSTGRAGVAAQLEAGEAAVGAGAVEAGLDCLRRGAAEARSFEVALQARALTSLGTALVHAVRGRDEEGVTALHRALHLDPTAGEAARELGYVEFLRGRYDRVEPWLVRAEQAACDDPDQRAKVLVVRGSALCDTGRYAEALAALREAEALTRDLRQRSYAQSMIGRAHLLRGELDAATDVLDASFALAQQQGWTTFLPWPESFRAEVDLTVGDLDKAQDRLDHAFALGCHVGDPCWEGLSARGLGLVASHRGEPQTAVLTLLDARARCTRLPDAYAWVDAYALDALCDVARAHALPEGHGWAQELTALASRTGMREMEVRALLHRTALGEPEAYATASALARDVDNPHLAELVECAR